jgi:hypothetical protein
MILGMPTVSFILVVGLPALILLWMAIACLRSNSDE